MFRTGMGTLAWALIGVGAGGALVEQLTSTAEVSGAQMRPPFVCGVEQVPPAPGEEPPVETGWRTAVEPKPLGEAAQKALAWLVEHQNQDGGWNQGEQSGQGRSGEEIERSNVADTCVAALALVRSGSTPRSGPYAEALARAVAFVCAKVEASDEDSLWVTDVRGTRVQSKIGTYVDTFVASMLLGEVENAMPDARSAARAEDCHTKVLRKIERNQRSDGGFDQQGWAPVLSQSLAGKALNRAAQRGSEVSADALAGNDRFFSGAGEPAAAAGVSLYASSAKLGALQESVITNARRERELKDELAKTDDKDERKALEKELDSIEAGRRNQNEVQLGIVDRLDDESFVAGFGSNGGEEFLSYMNISESLVLRADDGWRAWDGAIGDNLARVQNQDGSWTGHHCITGRTFCTSAALLVLLADRTQFPADILAQVR